MCMSSNLFNCFLYTKLKYLDFAIDILDKVSIPVSKQFDEEIEFEQSEYSDLLAILCIASRIRACTLVQFHSWLLCKKHSRMTIVSLLKLLCDVDKIQFNFSKFDVKIRNELISALDSIETLTEKIVPESSSFPYQTYMRFSDIDSKLHVLSTILFQAMDCEIEISSIFADHPLPTITNADWSMFLNYAASINYFYYVGTQTPLWYSIFSDNFDKENDRVFTSRDLITLSNVELFCNKALFNSGVDITDIEARKFRKMIGNLSNTNTRAYEKCINHFYKRYDEVRPKFNANSKACHSLLDEMIEFAKSKEVQHKGWHTLTCRRLENLVSERNRKKKVNL